MSAAWCTWPTDPDSEGLRVERSEKFRDGPAELGLHSPLGDAGRVGSHAGLELAQRACHVRTDEIGTQAQHLAELYEGRAELREGAA